MNEIIGFYVGGDGKEICKDILFNCEKEVQKAKEYGVGCHTCVYRCEDKCCSKARHSLLNSIRKKVYTTDLLKDIDYQLNFDSRNICEFYKTKAWHNSIRTISADFGLCYPQYSEEEKKITFKRFENVFDAFEYTAKKSKEEECKNLKRATAMYLKFAERIEEYEERGRFLEFIKKEIPDVYKLLAKEYERRKQK